MKTLHLYLSSTILFLACALFGQQSKTIAEQLGYPADAKLLILHADDAGMSHSVNRATIDAFDKGGINSASIMVPCPWFPEIAEHARKHQKLDFGVHLTLTAEWNYYKWDGVLPSSEIPSLINKDGYFYPTVEEVVQHANLAEVEKEIKAQVERAIAFGIIPTHLDSHMGTLFATPALFEIYLKVGREYGIPVFIPLNLAGNSIANLPEAIKVQLYPVDNLLMMDKNRPKEEWLSYYKNIIVNLRPGLNEIIIHLAYSDDEMRAICIEHPDFGADWRQLDLDAMISKDFLDLIQEQNIQLVTWGQIQQLLEKQSK